MRCFLALIVAGVLLTSCVGLSRPPRDAAELPATAVADGAAELPCAELPACPRRPPSDFRCPGRDGCGRLCDLCVGIGPCAVAEDLICAPDCSWCLP